MSAKDLTGSQVMTRCMAYGLIIAMGTSLVLRLMHCNSGDVKYLIAYRFWVETVPVILLVIAGIPFFIFKLYKPPEEDNEKRKKRRVQWARVPGFAAGVIANSVLWKFILDSLFEGIAK